VESATIKTTCIIVDDEPLAHRILEKHLSAVPDLELAGTFTRPADAFAFVRKYPVGLIFLDIQMPDMTGLELLSILQPPIPVIITTAHAEFAARSYEFEVVDYLLKPVPFPRFLKAVDRYFQRFALRQAPSITPVPTLPDFIFLKQDKIEHRVMLRDITDMEAFGNFVKVHTEQTGTLLVSTTMTDIEKKLPATDFVRVHKSHMVALQRITRMEGNWLYLSTGKTVPIGATYRALLLEKMR
jgi:DNA-binding LytR/AlgR family response regulator